MQGRALLAMAPQGRAKSDGLHAHRRPRSHLVGVTCFQRQRSNKSSWAMRPSGTAFSSAIMSSSKGLGGHPARRLFNPGERSRSTQTEDQVATEQPWLRPALDDFCRKIAHRFGCSGNTMRHRKMPKLDPSTSCRLGLRARRQACGRSVGGRHRASIAPICRSGVLALRRRTAPRIQRSASRQERELAPRCAPWRIAPYRDPSPASVHSDSCCGSNLLRPRGQPASRQLLQPRSPLEYGAHIGGSLMYICLGRWHMQLQARYNLRMKDRWHIYRAFAPNLPK